MLRDLSDAGFVATYDRFVALQGGRTNKVWQFGGNGKSKVLKLYCTTGANPLFDNNPNSEIICLNALDGTGLAPRLLGHDKHRLGHWIIYEHVTGLGWARDPVPVANLLTNLHAQAPLIGLQNGPNGSAEIKCQTLKILDQCQPGTRDRISASLPKQEIPPTDHRCLIHGDPVPGNIILSANKPMLIDWQCPTNGDPVEDIALFLSPSMQHLYRGAPLTQSEEQGFLAAYPDSTIVQRYHNLKPWYHWRMAAYCLWRVDQGDDDYAAGFDLENCCLST